MNFLIILFSLTFITVNCNIVSTFYDGKCTTVNNQLYYIGDELITEDGNAKSFGRIYSLNMDTIVHSKPKEADWKLEYEIKELAYTSDLKYTGSSLASNKLINMFFEVDRIRIFTFDTNNKRWELKQNTTNTFNQVANIPANEKLYDHIIFTKALQNDKNLNQIVVYGTKLGKNRAYLTNFIIIYNKKENNWANYKEHKLIEDPILSIYNGSLFIIGKNEDNKIKEDTVIKVNLDNGEISNSTTTGDIPIFKSNYVKSCIRDNDTLYFASANYQNTKFYTLKLDSLIWNKYEVNEIASINNKCMIVYKNKLILPFTNYLKNKQSTPIIDITNWTLSNELLFPTNQSKINLIIGSIVGIIILLCLIIIGVYCYKRNSNNQPIFCLRDNKKHVELTDAFTM